jgi:hypothetical protein
LIYINFWKEINWSPQKSNQIDTMVVEWKDMATQTIHTEKMPFARV